MRDGSANLHASAKLFALRVIEQDVTDNEISEIMTAHNKMMDVMGVYQHHDAVTGTAKQFVANDYNFNLVKAVNDNNKIY